MVLLQSTEPILKLEWCWMLSVSHHILVVNDRYVLHYNLFDPSMQSIPNVELVEKARVRGPYQHIRSIRLPKASFYMPPTHDGDGWRFCLGDLLFLGLLVMMDARDRHNCRSWTTTMAVLVEVLATKYSAKPSRMLSEIPNTALSAPTEMSLLAKLHSVDLPGLPTPPNKVLLSTPTCRRLFQLYVGTVSVDWAKYRMMVSGKEFSLIALMGKKNYALLLSSKKGQFSKFQLVCGAKTHSGVVPEYKSVRKLAPPDNIVSIILRVFCMAKRYHNVGHFQMSSDFRLADVNSSRLFYDQETRSAL